MILQVPSCTGSGLFKAFTEHILYRLGIKQESHRVSTSHHLQRWVKVMNKCTMADPVLTHSLLGCIYCQFSCYCEGIFAGCLVSLSIALYAIAIVLSLNLS